ncbi:Kelch-like protein diablo [Frankliniella fusca]|uniref:Kelch-like protein diablo n=1 Tax=Frankliniella fusca TaxID=407009 RepID=A0AAE1LMY6_9NEOP|nr:Kelch-like protein diablo [Frankliniella fusca]
MEDDLYTNLHYADSLLPTCIHQNLCHLWRSATLCDVVLTAEGKQIAAHRIVLAAASPYFRAMFTCKLREASENEVEMHEISFHLLQEVINFIYTTELKVTDDNVYDLMSIADILQLSSIRTACTSFLMSSLTPSNCLSVLTAASLHSGYNDLANAAIRFTRKHLCEVANNEEYFVAPVDVLLKVFQGRILNIPDEGFLLKIIIAWVKHDPCHRLKHLDKLSSAIHLVQVPMDTLVLSKQDPVVQNSNLQLQIKHTINTILEERYDSDVRTLWATGYKEKARRMLRFCDDQEVILALGGESNGMALGSVECLTLGYDNWKCVIPTAVQNAGGVCEDTKVIPTMKDPRSFFGICYSDDKVYVAGGSTPSTPIASVEVFHVNKNEWTSLPPLPLALTGVRMAFLHGQLFVTGGQSEEGAERRSWCLDEKCSNWKPSVPMSTTRAFHGLVTVGGALYSVGGKAGDGTVLNSVERYDPNENRWFKIASLNEARYDFGCVAIDQYIYVAGGIGGQQHWLRSVERYDTLTNQWCFVSPMSIARASFGISVSDNRIYCVGGYNGVHYTNTVEKFNPRTNRWHCVQAMQSRRYGVGAATLRVPVIAREES